MPTEREAIREMLRRRPDLHAKLKRAIEEGRITSTDEIPEGEPYTIVCGPDHGGVEGSKQVQCACGAKVWMSPSTQDLIKSRERLPTLIKCISCVMEEVKEPKQ